MLETACRYVRVGNGNKLVRNPKRRVRILASEKVRWSLHTARIRLARKKQYCQFFTRFGKCNKDNGKCPYIHDPSKIAVCTKFLNGSCSDTNCKLTHEVWYFSNPIIDVVAAWLVFAFLLVFTSYIIRLFLKECKTAPIFCKVGAITFMGVIIF